MHEDANNDGQLGGTERVRSVPLGDKVVFGRSTAPARPMGSGAINFAKTVGGLPALIFRRSGSASEEGGFYLTSRRAADSGTRPTDARAIEIERATGRATWYRYTSPNWTRGF